MCVYVEGVVERDVFLLFAKTDKKFMPKYNICLHKLKLLNVTKLSGTEYSRSSVLETKFCKLRLVVSRTKVYDTK